MIQFHKARTSLAGSWSEERRVPELLAETMKPKPKRNSKEEVVAALRELMHLGPNDPAPQPPPLPAKDDKKVSDDKEKKDSPKAATTAP